MCNRYKMERVAEINQMIHELGLQLPEDFAPRYNVAPSQMLPVVVRNDEGKYEISFMRWGLIPFFDRNPTTKVGPLNIRAETALQKFKHQVQKRRCLGIADGFFEFQEVGKLKVPHLFTVDGGKPFFFAACFERADDALRRPPSWALLTTRPNSVLAEVHDRSPVVLDRQAGQEWLEPGEMSPVRLERFATPFPAERMARVRVSSLINNSRNDVKEALEPQPDAPAPPQSSVAVQGELF